MKNELGDIPKISLDDKGLKEEDKLPIQKEEKLPIQKEEDDLLIQTEEPISLEETVKEEVSEPKKVDNKNYFTDKDKLNKTLTIILVASITVVILILLGFGLKKLIDYSNARNIAEENKSSDRVGIEKAPGDEDTDGGDPIIVNEDLNANQARKKRYYKGFEVVGDIRIPATNLSLPILKPMSNKSLEASVVQEHTITGLNGVGNTTISGHNYRNDLFFANNYRIKVGDSVYIKDEISLKELKYDVYDIKEVGENDKSFVQRNTNGAIEVTLSTCTDNAINRIVIFAKHIPQTGE